MKEKNLTHEKILVIAKKSLKEIEENSKIIIIKKKYLGKDGIITQLFKQISLEKNNEKRKKIGDLLNK